MTMMLLVTAITSTVVKKDDGRATNDKDNDVDDDVAGNSNYIKRSNEKMTGGPQRIKTTTMTMTLMLVTAIKSNVV